MQIPRQASESLRTFAYQNKTKKETYVRKERNIMRRGWSDYKF